MQPIRSTGKFLIDRHGRVAASIVLGLLLSACTTPDKKSPPTGETAATYAPTADKPPPAQTAIKATGDAPTGKQCREFQHEIMIAGKQEKAYGTACLQPDGTWKQEGTAHPEPAPQAAPEVAQSFPYKGLPPTHYYHGRPYYPVYRPYYPRFGYGFRRRGFGYWSYY